MDLRLSGSLPAIRFGWEETYNSNVVITIYRMLMPSEYLKHITTLSAEDFRAHLREVHRTLIMPCEAISAVYVEALVELSARNN